jgi:hypothetical protein
MDDRDVIARVWESVHFDLDETCFGYVLRDDEGVVYTYERSVLGAASRRLAPCFSRREHAQLFASQWPDRPTLGEGPSYDLGALRDAIEARDEGTTDAAYAWTFVIDVLDAVGEGDDFELPDTGLVDPDEIRDALSRFRSVLDLLDRAPDED